MNNASRTNVHQPLLSDLLARRWRIKGVTRGCLGRETWQIRKSAAKLASASLPCKSRLLSGTETKSSFKYCMGSAGLRHHSLLFCKTLYRCWYLVTYRRQQMVLCVIPEDFSCSASSMSARSTSRYFRFSLSFGKVETLRIFGFQVVCG